MYLYVDFRIALLTGCNDWGEVRVVKMLYLIKSLFRSQKSEENTGFFPELQPIKGLWTVLTGRDVATGGVWGCVTPPQ